MKDQNNIQNIMDENLKKQLVSSNAQIKKTQKQLERQQKIKLKEFEISEPVTFKKAKILSKKLNIDISKFIGCDLSDYDENGNLISGKRGFDVGFFQKTQKETLSQEIENLQVANGLNTKSENQGREKTLENLTGNQNEKKVEKIDLSEIQKLKEEISPTENIVEAEKISSNVKKIDPEELKKLKEQISLEENPEGQQKSQEAQKEENENQTERDISESFENQPVEKTQNVSNLETEQNQSDSGQVFEQNQTAENHVKKATSNEQASEFAGMSEEEISAELERRKRLADLKLKYSEDNKNANDIGEYKKNLDFSSNTNIKHFKMRPPKKILIIILSVVFALVALAVSLTIYFVKKPPAPATLVNSKISQSTIYHYVGEKINLTGITIEQLYSDGSKKSIPVDVSNISQRSSNIGSDLTILEFGENSFLEFAVDGKKHKLNINLNELRIAGIKEIIHPTEQYSSESKINFDTILILVNIKDRENNDFEPKRISSKNATFKIEGQVENLLTDEDGILLYRFDESSNIVTLPEGNYNIIVTIEEKGTTFSASFSIQIFNIE